MEVKFLGTGSMYSKFNCSSLIIDKRILVDIGPGSVKQLIKEEYDYLGIDTILITHLHADHILDFGLFLGNIDVRGINHIIDIYGPTGTKDKIVGLVQLLFGNYYDEFIDKYFNFIEISDSLIIKDKVYDIKVYEVIHTGIDAYGFVIDSRLGITGDSSYCDKVIDIFNESKILIADCSLVDGDIYHMGVDDIKKLLKIDNTKKIILTHHRDSTREELDTSNLDNVIISDDGYCFSVNN